jgi:hypothetical protein
MNERIRQLAEQAGFNIDFEPSTVEEDKSYQVVSNDFAECFAQLIIRECAGIAYEYDLPNHTGILPGEFIGNRMKRLFGVES